MKSLAIACFAFMFISSLSFADCPPTEKVKYGCSVIAGHKHCNWSAPWYEGFPEKDAKGGDVALSFKYVFWGAKTNNPQPHDIGSTVCFYNSPNGHEIELVQNNWGGIKYPEEAVWSKSDWQGHPGLICNGSSCHFSYPA